MPRTQTFAHLISDTTHTTLYESLASVEQDDAWISLEAHPQGLYSDGITGWAKPSPILLFHVDTLN